MKILFTVLNWGLGHATRSAPLIRALTERGAQVILAGDGDSKSYLHDSFPGLEIRELPSYPIKYGKSAMATRLQLVQSSPGIKSTIEQERKVVEQWIEAESFDYIISDNRYGCHHPKIPSILITHQLNIAAPFASFLVNKVIKNYLKPFHRIWVPDVENPEINLSGDLSHPKAESLPVEYIGPLSNLPVKPGKKDLEWLGIVSGPEPQQSLFYQALLKIQAKHPLRITLARGLSQKELTPLWNRAQKIICRSGYSSIMDLALHQKPAILVPTPGQDEQLYLGKWFQNDCSFKVIQQNEIDDRWVDWEPENKKVHTRWTSFYMEAIESLFPTSN
ncbi:glycosyltransferase [bacterium SCSIO 12741]|nr:glycosyltransferase [bacterium SCSIO 12741]